jgi:hypothetical protein
MTAPEPWSIFADKARFPQVSNDTVLLWISKRKLPAHLEMRTGRLRIRVYDPRVRPVEAVNSSNLESAW